MRYFTTSSGFRSSAGAIAAVTVTGLIAFLFESPYTAWGRRTVPATDEVALSIPAADHDVRNI